MLLRMKTILADAGGMVLQPGDSHDFPDDEAQALLAGDFAEDIVAMEAAAEQERAAARAAKLAATAGGEAAGEAGAKVVTPKGGKGGGKGPKPAAATAD